MKYLLELLLQNKYGMNRDFFLKKLSFGKLENIIGRRQNKYGTKVLELNVFNNSILPSLHFCIVKNYINIYESYKFESVTVADPETRQFITGKNREHL